MKLLIVTLGLLSSVSLFADTSELIINPEINGVHFSGGSDENGVCRALGYERAAVGATLYKDVGRQPMVEVNRRGDVSGGDIGSNYHQIQQIVCLNLEGYPRFDLNLIHKPLLSGELAISGGSSENGVCKALGYEKAVVGASLYTDVSRKPMVEINNRGSVSGGDIGSNYHQFDTIVCVNMVGASQISGKLIENPRHPISGQPFSGGSHESGVCKALGFSHAAVGATMYVDVSNTPMLEVDSEGSVSGGDTGNKYHAVKKIICID